MLITYIIRRILWSVPFLFVVSLIAFALIQAPPGDYLTTFAATLAQSGDVVDQERLELLRERYGLDQPFIVQYWKWITGVLVGDFGISFEWQQPVSNLIWERMALSVTLALSTLLFTWAVAFPIGVYSAVKKYTLGDYVITAVGFIGLAMPSFLVALVLMYIAVVFFGSDVSGLFSEEFEKAPWSLAKIGDLMSHLWLPVVILGLGSTASLTRIMRANLLDELHKPYVTTARAKGLSELRLILKYPVRMALNPFVSTLGWAFPQLISGAVITAFVLSLPTSGPLLLQALLAQDMYLAGAFILLLCCLSVVGMLVSDILLAVIDPRIRYR
ncbi:MULTISPECIES: ABC transporter permease [unclassified Chelatococcus]|uniref:ABC transporter permease n=1 Tax=unclassified Chelatococcus TaxID=2638111 RepID=UPI001BD14068|nr:MULTISPECIES: ABC transporter permease [unclassified Chelatococcus]CAH1657724.1 Peptide/nickel transport system permease protein [Hyphomicrobiales bacterium]MBS7740715.1 ABC transporter permease [Chelatococcus sp. HY11]MBX3546051.1 ABC transporter permease [Chelatococcus sp.]MCO5079800.1 ABC transporter permease [Chelatococcus sp.]CAH1684346.1 Peptide/nickel transport system permease protein [Hyphomicrobiales bacterium]